MDTVTLDRINRELEIKWGGRPKYRVVFANDQLETRARYDEHGRFEIALLPKYQGCKDCYILEKDVREFGSPPEIKDWNGYEIIWPFKKGGTEEPIDPSVKVCMFITESLEHGVKKTAKDYFDMEKKEFDAEVERTFEALNIED